MFQTFDLFQLDRYKRTQQFGTIGCTWWRKLSVLAAIDIGRWGGLILWLIKGEFNDGYSCLSWEVRDES